jgi:hypothetical protein
MLDAKGTKVLLSSQREEEQCMPDDPNRVTISRLHYRYPGWVDVCGFGMLCWADGGGFGAFCDKFMAQSRDSDTSTNSTSFHRRQRQEFTMLLTHFYSRKHRI